MHKPGRTHSRILDLLYPPVCPFCGRIERKGICAVCRKKIVYIDEPRCMKCGKPLETEEEEYCSDCLRHTLSYAQGRSLWVHKEPVSTAIYQFKYHNKRVYADVFGEELAKRYGRQIENWKIEEILPIPLHSSRQRRRGFNQAELVARKLGEYTEIPVNAGALQRVRKTMPQKLLSDSERRKNIQRAFGVVKTWKPKRNVLLIDDIYTTGNTIHAAAKILKKAGAQNVYFLTISIGQGL
ncbi:ComF family protein [Ruminococcus sp. AF18-22]|uniref:ComF family protein n=1 Tax=Mediterraneibacter sp. ICN-202921 TaxID=3134657 RepID=UPI000E4F7211|nr:ComF family protein [Ruminococcus sp. AF18-22]